MTEPRIRLSPEGDGSGTPIERRAGSVQLRDVAQMPGVPTGDPANQSIADALRISFFLLKLGMLTLAVLYLLSGFKFVKEGEQGISLLFGRVESANVEPGFRYSWPFPLGEMVRVGTGANDIPIDRAFWVEMEPGKDHTTPIDQLTPKPSLEPRLDAGSLLTADGNIAHARVQAIYRRTDPGAYAENIYPGDDEGLSDERMLVGMAIQSGVVHAVAQVTIDDLLKQKAGDQGVVAAVARREAQDLLDSLSSGLTIDSLSLEPIAPLFVRADFAKVQAAVSEAAKMTEVARLESQRSLNGAAGAAAPALVAAIAEFEAAITKGQPDAQTAALAKVDAILDSGKAEWNGQEVILTGEASRLLSNARQYRAEISAKRRGQLDAFEAKLAQFGANPELMVQREWASAVRDFYSRDNVEIFMMYPGIGTLAIQLNRDQEIARKQLMDMKQRELFEVQQKRNAEWQGTKFKTDVQPTGTQ